ncbi:MAG: hypothetical protein Tsb0014_33870 [Pleurocapsa sp.]
MNDRFLENFATIEINTVIVEEIVDDIFIPWEAYQEIYTISRPWLQASPIHTSLHHRYLQLRRQLELAYNLLLVDPSSQLYNRALAAEIKRNLPILATSKREWENISSKLPEPISQETERPIAQIEKLLSDRRFLTTLRQLKQNKTILDQRDRLLRNHSQDILNTTYAQTVIHLDGKIINRYTQQILDRRDREKLLQLHQYSVQTGEKQWRELLKFIFNFAPKSFKR